MFLQLMQIISSIYVYDFAARIGSNKDIVEVSVAAKLNSVLAAICSTDRLLADIQISGLLMLVIVFYSLRHFVYGSFVM